MKKCTAVIIFCALLLSLAPSTCAIDALIREYYNADIKAGSIVATSDTDSISSDTTYIEFALD